jgi:hypothetical protein
VNSFGQANSYTFSQSSGTYTPITPSGTPAATFGTSFDDVSFTFTLPFTFNFAGTPHTQVTVSSNGFLVFGSSLSANAGGAAYVSTSDPSGIFLGGTVTQSGIAGMNEDWLGMTLATFTANRTLGSPIITNVAAINFTRLRLGMRCNGTGFGAGTIIVGLNAAAGEVTLSNNATATGTGTTFTPGSSIITQTLGGGTTQTFVIQYTDMRRFSTAGNGDSVYFQIRLNQANNVAINQNIDIVFGNVKTTQTTTFTAQSGIRTTTADFNSRTTTTDWSATTASGSNTAGCVWNSTVFPANGQKYTWTPAPPVACALTINNLIPTGTIFPGCGQTYAPKVNILNTGSSAQGNISVTYSVSPAGYNPPAVTGLSLASGANMDVNFSGLSLSSADAGVQNVTVTVTSDCAGPYVLNTSFTVSPLNPNFGGPTFGYYFANSTSGASCAPDQPVFFWEDTTGSTYLTVDGIATTPLSAGNLDDGGWVISPLFSTGDGIKYNGICYTDLAISTNGMIGLGTSTTGISSSSIGNIPNTNGPELFPLWYDQDFRPAANSGFAGSRSIGYKISGQKLVITYAQAPSYTAGATGPTDYVSYQVIIEIGISCGTGNGTIICQYDDSKSGAAFLAKYNANTILSSVGIQNETGIVGIQYRRTTPVVTAGGPLFGSPMALAFGPLQGALPVELASFTATSKGNNVDLLWSTTAETNNQGFDIERSSVSGSWTKVANVAGNGTTTTSHSYSYTDRNLASGNYNYRLKQIDFNGNFEYFNLSNEVNVGTPTKFDLSQNYPNPFNPSTSINFDLPVDGKVSLKIYDMSGKEVMTLVNEVRTAGYHSVSFNASSLSSGVYFYTLSADNFTATKKMMLLK